MSVSIYNSRQIRLSKILQILRLRRAEYLNALRDAEMTSREEKTGSGDSSGGIGETDESERFQRRRLA